jgi:hypothetical protein
MLKLVTRRRAFSVVDGDSVFQWHVSVLGLILVDVLCAKMYHLSCCPHCYPTSAEMHFQAWFFRGDIPGEYA